MTQPNALVKMATMTGLALVGTYVIRSLNKKHKSESKLKNELTDSDKYKTSVTTDSDKYKTSIATDSDKYKTSVATDLDKYKTGITTPVLYDEMDLEIEYSYESHEYQTSHDLVKKENENKAKLEASVKALSAKQMALTTEIKEAKMSELLPKIYELTNTPINFKSSRAHIYGQNYVDFDGWHYPPTYEMKFTYIMDNYPEVTLYMHNKGLICLDGQSIKDTTTVPTNPKYLPAYLVYNKLLNGNVCYSSYGYLDKHYFPVTSYSLPSIFGNIYLNEKN